VDSLGKKNWFILGVYKTTKKMKSEVIEETT